MFGDPVTWAPLGPGDAGRTGAPEAPWLPTPLEAVLVLDAPDAPRVGAARGVRGRAVDIAVLAADETIVCELGRTEHGRHGRPLGRVRLIYRLRLPTIGPGDALKNAFDVAQAVADTILAPLLSG